MKWSGFLLGIYVLLLSFLPCADSRECNAPSEPRLTVLTSGHEDHQHERESCAPFCICACCGTLTIFQQAQAYPLSPAPLQERAEFHNVIAFHSYDFHTVWQPPQLWS